MKHLAYLLLLCGSLAFAAVDRFSLEEIPEAYHVFSGKLDGCIKPLIRPSAA